jgi:hypothetical protein
LDSDEVFLFGTDPTLADSDFDSMNDGAEIVAGNNPLNPDEDGDGNRDYLTPELSNPEGIVVSTFRESSAIFVFDTILPEDTYATLVINSTIIPLTSQCQVFLYLESGKLYNYELHVPRNVIPNFSFIDTSRLDSSTFSLLNTSIDTNDASNEEEKIMSEERKLIYTLDDTTPIYRGKIANAYIEFVHLPDSTLFPPQSPCIHGEEEISVRLRTVPSEFLAKGEIIDVDNLVHEGNNIYTMAVNGIGQNNSTYGSITYRCPESKEEVKVYVNAHICESIAGIYCYGCGVYHNNGECQIHTGICQIPTVKETNCNCEPEIVEIKLCDINANGIEDKSENIPENLTNIRLIDNEEKCCCNSGASHSFTSDVNCGIGLEIVNNITNAIDVVGKAPSEVDGYTPITYDVYNTLGEKVNSITKKAIVLGLDLMFDYNDSGQINSDDKQIQYYHTISNYYVSASSEILPIQINAEIPPNLTVVCDSPKLSLYEDANGSIPYVTSTELSSGIHSLYYQSSLINETATISASCSNYLSMNQKITFVDTTLTNMVAKVGDMITLPYYGSSTTNRITIYEQGSSVPCLTTDSDGKWVAGIPEGEYRMEVFYYDIYKDGVKGFTKDCSLIISGYNIIAGDYGLKCGTNNFLRINVFNNPDIQFNITWKISPDESNGAKLSISEKSTKSNQIQTNASSIYVHAGIETNNYIITGWVDNKEIIASTNISVHVFPYEIDAPDQIVRSHSIKSAPIGVETLTEYNSHSWKLEKAFNASGGTSEEDDGKIGISPNLINSTELNSDKIYYKAGMAGEKFNLTATHELYTNVTDTVEFRTCDIFFNPISCESVGNGYVLNPRGFVYNDETHYKLEVEPESFLYNSVIWEGTTPLLVTPRDEKNLYVGLNTAQGPDEYFDNEITIQIPDYYELPPKFTVRIYNSYKTVKLQPIVTKVREDLYINYSIASNQYIDENSFASSNEFYSVFLPKLSQYIEYSNKIFRQIGVEIQLDEIIEYTNPSFFGFNIESSYVFLDQYTDGYDGIRVFVSECFCRGNDIIYGYEGLTYYTDSSKTNYTAIVIKKDINLLAFPHEIGHTMMLKDIYLDKYNYFNVPPTNNDLPCDFTGEINYYNKSLSDIINSCLMLGKLNFSSSASNTIIPLGKINGNSEVNKFANPEKIAVGQMDINRQPSRK